MCESSRGKYLLYGAYVVGFEGGEITLEILEGGVKCQVAGHRGIRSAVFGGRHRARRLLWLFFRAGLMLHSQAKAISGSCISAILRARNVR